MLEQDEENEQNNEVVTTCANVLSVIVPLASSDRRCEKRTLLGEELHVSRRSIERNTFVDCYVPFRAVRSIEVRRDYWMVVSSFVDPS